MNDIELVVTLLGVAAAATWPARALGVPYPIFLVLDLETLTELLA